MPVARVCETCEKRFFVRPSKVADGRGKFCSRTCQGKAHAHILIVGATGSGNPAWKGGVTQDNYRYTKRYRERHPEARQAQIAVSVARRSGRLIPGPCADCGSADNIHAHHEDYSKPLDVVWLCASCHRVRHGATC